MDDVLKRFEESGEVSEHDEYIMTDMDFDKEKIVSVWNRRSDGGAPENRELSKVSTLKCD